MLSIHPSDRKILIPVLVSFGGALIFGLTARFLLPSASAWLLMAAASAGGAVAAGLCQLVSLNMYLGELAHMLKRLSLGNSLPPESIQGLTRNLENEFRQLSDRLEEWTRVRQRSNDTLRVEMTALLDYFENWRNSLTSTDEHLNRLFQQCDGLNNELERITPISRALLDNKEGILGTMHAVAKEIEQASSTAHEGIKTVGHEIKAISELKSSFGSSTKIVTELNEMSRHVNDFIAVIAAISRKTQLLSLNASIEAARAGEHGKGFAVVASEIRTLSESSKRATEDISLLIQEIHRRTAEIIRVVQNTGKLEENIEVIYSTGDTFMLIVHEVKKIDASVNSVEEILAGSFRDSDEITGFLSQLRLQLEQLGKQVLDAKNVLSDLQDPGPKIRETQDRMLRALALETRG